MTSSEEIFRMNRHSHQTQEEKDKIRRHEDELQKQKDYELAIVKEKPITKYWEDHFCEICDKITIFKRMQDWYMYCSECFSQSSRYADPLRQYQIKDSPEKVQEYFAQKLEKRLKTVFDNIESVRPSFKENQTTDELKKLMRIYFHDIDGEVHDVDYKCNRTEQAISIAEANFKATGSKINLTTYGPEKYNSLMEKMEAEWNQYFRMQYDKQNALMEKVISTFRVQRIRINREGITFHFDLPIIHGEEIIENQTMHWD
jgi:hypothetical protein